MSLVKLSIILAAAAYQDSEPQPIVPTLEVPPAQEQGRASWYGDGALHGSVTASGEEFDPDLFTCAHRTLPLQTTVLLVNRRDPTKRVWCRINDRGPYGATLEDGSWGVKKSASDAGDYRGILDVSIAAAKQLGTYGQGRQPIAIHYATRRTRASEPVAFAAAPE